MKTIIALIMLSMFSVGCQKKKGSRSPVAAPLATTTPAPMPSNRPTVSNPQPVNENIGRETEIPNENGDCFGNDKKRGKWGKWSKFKRKFGKKDDCCFDDCRFDDDDDNGNLPKPR
ncbi:MAG: hypothetical protein CMP10_20875 [Zetaproteobacteria bacterium]|nr:hypothetical protein [Pseudobdellovibrionaceae bacterium]|tara:strand:+ start:956 stop:1303 length:348 start_codon:yes stop_codon:yes gene_type:complete